MPANIDQILKSQLQVQPTAQTYASSMNSSILKQRQQILRQNLLQKVYNDFKNFQNRRQDISHYDVFANKRWPGIFDLNNPQLVDDLPLAKLAEQPQQARKVSVNDFINTHDKSKQIKAMLEAETEKKKDQEMDQSDEDQSINSNSDSSEEARQK